MDSQLAKGCWMLRKRPADLMEEVRGIKGIREGVVRVKSGRVGSVEKTLAQANRIPLTHDPLSVSPPFPAIQITNGIHSGFDRMPPRAVKLIIQEGISVECKPPACQQYMLHNQQM